MGFLNRKEKEEDEARHKAWVKASEQHHNYRSPVGDRICYHTNLADTGQRDGTRRVLRCTATGCGYTVTE